jgi:hypothetical protein
VHATSRQQPEEGGRCSGMQPNAAPVCMSTQHAAAATAAAEKGKARDGSAVPPRPGGLLTPPVRAPLHATRAPLPAAGLNISAIPRRCPPCRLPGTRQPVQRETTGGDQLYPRSPGREGCFARGVLLRNIRCCTRAPSLSARCVQALATTKTAHLLSQDVHSRISGQFLIQSRVDGVANRHLWVEHATRSLEIAAQKPQTLWPRPIQAPLPPIK